MADPEPTDGAPAPATPYVAVAFFHGIGQQRRFETTSHLLEAVDDYVYASHRERDPAFEIPRLEIKPRIEKLRGGNKDDRESIVYLQAKYGKKRVRFYEGYWAPATVLGTTTNSVLLWVVAQLFRPIAVLRAPWRSFARLRRTDLLRLRRPGEEDLSLKLLALYRRFVAQRDGRSVSFARFIEFVRSSGAAESSDDLVQGAKSWRRRHVWLELRHAALLAFFGLTIIAGFVLILIATLQLLAASSNITPLKDLLPEDALEATPRNALSVISLLLGGIGVSALVRDYVGDIQQFVTYEEAQPLYERRQKILEMAESTLRHLLMDDRCERIVVVSHSLGTAVALDAVLRLRLANQAEDPSADGGKVMKGPLPLERIQHFITCGSPIDKINYFFAALRSTSRSYESLVESLRGDINSVPFSRSGLQPYVHWINFWDLGDPISGPIRTVAGEIVREQRVDDVRVASFLLPDPAASHDGYIRHRDMIRTVFHAAFDDSFSFAHAVGVPGQPIAWPWVGPGGGAWLQTTLLLAWPLTAALVIYTALAALIPSLSPPYGTLAVIVALLLFAPAAQRRLRLHRAPVEGKQIRAR